MSNSDFEKAKEDRTTKVGAFLVITIVLLVLSGFFSHISLTILVAITSFMLGGGIGKLSSMDEFEPHIKFIDEDESNASS